MSSAEWSGQSTLVPKKEKNYRIGYTFYLVKGSKYCLREPIIGTPARDETLTPEPPLDFGGAERQKNKWDTSAD
jgi:hypothetical protein